MKINYTSDVLKIPDLQRFAIIETNLSNVLSSITSDHGCIKVQFFLIKKYVNVLAGKTGVSMLTSFIGERDKMVGSK